MTHSETLFKQAQKYIPGGVNSRFAHSVVWAAPQSFSNTLKARTCTTKMASVISITLALGAR